MGEGIRPKITEKDIKQIQGKYRIKVFAPDPMYIHPCWILNVPFYRDYEPSCLYNFPGSHDIGVLTGVQDHSLDKLKRVIVIAEKILKFCGMSALVLTVNPAFTHERALINIGFTKSTVTGNPHSGNIIRFFIKEI